MICLFDQKEFEISKTKDLLKFECEYCHSTYERQKIQYLQHIRNQKKMISFCSKKCRSLGEETLVFFSCVQCQKEFTRLKKEISKNNFCSKSCSAIWTNKNYNKSKKIKLEKKCSVCEEIISKSRKYCSKCRSSKDTKTINSILVLTKSDLFKNRTSWQSARSSIQKLARSIFFSKFKNCKCKICGYNKHIEVAHIKSVKDFSSNSLISEINDLSNLVGLCPNHHWEFDNGILTIEMVTG